MARNGRRRKTYLISESEHDDGQDRRSEDLSASRGKVSAIPQPIISESQHQEHSLKKSLNRSAGLLVRQGDEEGRAGVLTGRGVDELVRVECVERSLVAVEEVESAPVARRIVDRDES